MAWRKLSDQELIGRGIVPTRQTVTFTRRMRLGTRRQLAAAMVAAKRAHIAAAPQKVPESMRVRAVNFGVTDLQKLARIHASADATQAMLDEDTPPDRYIGLVYSSLVTFEYLRMKGEYRKALRRAGTSAARASVERTWQRTTAAAIDAFARAGLAGLVRADLDRLEQTLNSSAAFLNAVRTIADSGVERGEVRAAPFVTAEIVPQTDASLPDNTIDIPANPCDGPLAEGWYTKHISKSFSIPVTITVWCPTWRHPFRTCRKTIIIAGVSVSLDLDVGYRVTCCGLSAWGVVVAEACGTLVGITVCASCTAEVIGAAGVGRVGADGATCTYGAGLEAALSCEVAGVTIVYVEYTLGLLVDLPCPPPGTPC